MHVYKGVRSDYFDQILGEIKAPSRKHGGKKVYQPRAGVAHEVLDCEAYQIHLARFMRLHLKSPADWDAIEADLMQTDLLADTEVEVLTSNELPAPEQNLPEPEPTIETATADF